MEFLKEYTTQTGEVLLYTGNPNFEKLEVLSKGVGDIWHSSFEQGYKNAFPELVYQTAIFFWYINDFENLDECVSWRINPSAFVVRKSVWEIIKGFDTDFESQQTQALDFGFQCLRFFGGIPLYHKALFSDVEVQNVVISRQDRHLFLSKKF